MANGYQVDLAALQAAADGITRTVGQVDAHPVVSLAVGGGSLGHARLAAALGGFCERWQAGVATLVADGRAAEAHLTQAAAAYERVDAAARDGFGGTLRQPGPDPAPR
jgi:NAD(P)H-dependent FMN reductase